MSTPESIQHNHRSREQSENRTIAILQPPRHDPYNGIWNPLLVNQFQSIVMDAGYSAAWLPANCPDLKRRMEAFDAFALFQPATAFPSLCSAVEKTGKPFALLSYDYPRPNSVFYDTTAAVQRLMLYLMKMQIRHLLFVSTPDFLLGELLRHNGKRCLNVIRDCYNYQLDFKCGIVDFRSSIDPVEQTACLLRGSENERTAVIAVNDYLADLIYKFIAKPNAFMPENYLLISFNIAPYDRLRIPHIDYKYQQSAQFMLELLQLQFDTSTCRIPGRIIMPDFNLAIYDSVLPE